jgi:hypothetical protein
MKCKNCKDKDAIKYSKYSNGLFCSKKCARSYSTKDKRIEINKKVSEKLKGLGNDNVKKKCKNCNDDFIVIWSKRNQSFCSKKCGSQYSNNQPDKRDKLSKARINSIKNGIINGAGIKSTYLFNNKEIKCDSKIENACLNYFENLGAVEISRSDIVIIYYDHNNKKRRFLPDFEVKMDNKKYLVEAKGYMSIKSIDKKWREYNKISSIKKEVLINYCKKNTFEPFWFTKNLNRKYYDNLIELNG